MKPSVDQYLFDDNHNQNINNNYLHGLISKTKNKIITSPERIFALPSNQNLYISLRQNNKIKKIKVKKDDCVQNFFKKIIYVLKYKNFEIFYKKLIYDAVIRDKIKNCKT